MSSQDCIWYGGPNSPTEQAYLRETFFLDGPVITGALIGGVDDDARIWINGTVVYDVFNLAQGSFGPINIAPYLVPGQNLIAVFADDNLAFGYEHSFRAQTDVETTADVAAVPEPASLGLLATGLGVLAARRRRTKQH